MKLLLFILSSSIFISCGRGYLLTELYSQPIEYSDKVLIEYFSISTLNDGVKTGKTILDKNEEIKVETAESMPFDFLIGRPQKDMLHVIKIKEGDSKIPKYMSSEFSKSKGITVKTDYYVYENCSSHNLTYKFSSVRETKDSLIILGLEKVLFNIPTDKIEISFLKGNIRLIESNSLKGVIKQIQIPAFLFKKFNNTTVDNITVIRNDSLKVDGLIHFTFLPIKPISSNLLSNNGIYRNRQIRGEKTLN